MDAFRSAVEAQNIDGMAAELADDVEFHSPFAFRPFVGKESVSQLLAAVMDTFTDFEYTDELDGEGAKILVFNAAVGDTKVQGIDLIRRGDDGLIDHFTVMLRPANGLMAMGQAMAPKVEALAKGPAPK